MLPINLNPKPHNPELCACGCGVRVPASELKPRFASTVCRSRWVQQWALDPDGVEAAAVLDDRPQDLPPPAVPVSVEEVAEAQAEFAERVAVAPQADAVLQAVPLRVRPRARLMWELIAKRRRKVQ